MQAAGDIGKGIGSIDGMMVVEESCYRYKGLRATTVATTVWYGDSIGGWEVIYTGKQSVDMLGK